MPFEAFQVQDVKVGMAKIPPFRLASKRFSGLKRLRKTVSLLTFACWKQLASYFSGRASRRAVLRAVKTNYRSLIGLEVFHMFQYTVTNIEKQQI